MRAVLVNEFESLSRGLRSDIGQFCAGLPPHTPVFWTITTDASPQFPKAENGFLQKRGDRIFAKPDIDSTLNTAYDHGGELIIPALQAEGITSVFGVGATFYGSVLGAGMHLREHGIRAVIIDDLTDSAKLSTEEHAEGMPSLRKAKIPLISQKDALRLLTGPNNRARGFNL